MTASTTDADEVATCRGCGRVLRGKPYYQGGEAFIPETGEPAKANHYGGFVCSYECDRRSSLRMENDMPGGGSTRLSCFAQERLERNWPRA